MPDSDDLSFPDALKKAEEWMKIEGVEGVAQGLSPDGRDCICVFTSRPGIADRFPAELGGHPVIVEETGEFHAGV